VSFAVQAACVCPESAKAAVRRGADELLIRFHAEPPLAAQLAADITVYCRLRGVVTVLDLSHAHTDKTLPDSYGVLRACYRAGLDAALVADIGVLRMVRAEAPDALIHWLGVHSSSGLRFASDAGCSRAVLAPYSRLTEDSLTSRGGGKLQLQLPIYSRGCLSSASVPCFLSGPRCARACEKPYGYANKADSTPLSAPAIDLLARGPNLARSGIDVFGVDAYPCTPEENAYVVKVARDALAGKGYRPEKKESLSQELRREDENAPEPPRVAVRFLFKLQHALPAGIAADDYCGHTEYTAGPEPADTPEHFLSEAEYNMRLRNHCAPPFFCKDAKSEIDGALAIPGADFARMKADVLAKLHQARVAPPERAPGHFNPGVHIYPRRDDPAVTVHLTRADQLTPDLAELMPERLYLPLDEIVKAPQRVRQAADKGVTAVAFLPRVITDDEQPGVAESLQKARALGLREAAVSHPCHIAVAANAGFAVRADFCVSNSQTLRELRRMGALSALLSPALPLAAVRELSHVLDTELLIYGRLPLLLSEACLIRKNGNLCNCDGRTALVDKRGEYYPVVRESGHRSLLLGASKLWMVKKRAWKRAGLWAARLFFTTENARECVQVTERHMGRGRYEPNRHDTGFYFMEQ
jgi:putative protease